MVRLPSALLLAYIGQMATTGVAKGIGAEDIFPDSDIDLDRFRAACPEYQQYAVYPQ
jgi:hypothetical protein